MRHLSSVSIAVVAAIFGAFAVVQFYRQEAKDHPPTTTGTGGNVADFSSMSYFEIEANKAGSPNSPGEIFQRVLGHSPDAKDRILKAERIETKLPGIGIRWTSYLSVEASPGLLTQLREDDILGLQILKETEVPTDAPEWFKFDVSSMTARTTPQKSLKVYLPKSGNFIYALTEVTLRVPIVAESPPVDVSRKWPTKFPVNDPEHLEIFRECLGFGPYPFDRILHAKRQETKRSDGKTQIEFFMVLEVTENFQYLIEHRPAGTFSKTIDKAPFLSETSPVWFKVQPKGTTNWWYGLVSNGFVQGPDQGHLVYVCKTRVLTK